MSLGKAPGKSGISPDILKYRSNNLVKRRLELFKIIMKIGQVPQDFKDIFVKTKKIELSVITHGPSLFFTRS